MFGAVAAFVNGNMFAGLFGDNVGVKLDHAGLVELAALPGSGSFGPEERPMGGYLSLPGNLSDPEKTAWMTGFSRPSSIELVQSTLYSPS